MRSKRRTLCRIAAVTAALYLVGWVTSAQRPWLLYNHTPSVPIGFYRLRRDGRIGRGDLVAFPLPRAAYAYARERGDGTRVRLLKPVLAVAGDRVSTQHGELRINGRWVCVIPDTDGAGRALPRWRHARTLRSGELFVGSTRIADSFGSRFFGPIHTDQVIGVYRPLWLLPSLDDPKALLNDATASTATAPNGTRVSRACGAAPVRGCLLRSGAPTNRTKLDDLTAFAPHGEPRIHGAWACMIPDTATASRALPCLRHACTPRPDELFVGSTHIADSFGSRFFGPIPTDQVIGVDRPLWLPPSLGVANARPNHTLTSPAAAPVGACRGGTAAVTRD